MRAKIREYLFGLTPLFFAGFVLALLKISFSSSMLFVVAYLWHLFLVFPTTAELMSRRGYRFSFVRIIYLFYLKLSAVINRRQYFIIEAILRALGPFLFTMCFQYFFGGVQIFLLLMGSLYFELIYFSRLTLQAKVPPLLP